MNNNPNGRRLPPYQPPRRTSSVAVENQTNNNTNGVNSHARATSTRLFPSLINQTPLNNNYNNNLIARNESDFISRPSLMSNLTNSTAATPHSRARLTNNGRNLSSSFASQSNTQDNVDSDSDEDGTMTLLNNLVNSASRGNVLPSDNTSSDESDDDDVEIDYTNWPEPPKDFEDPSHRKLPCHACKKRSDIRCCSVINNDLVACGQVICRRCIDHRVSVFGSRYDRYLCWFCFISANEEICRDKGISLGAAFDETSEAITDGRGSAVSHLTEATTTRTSGNVSASVDFVAPDSTHVGGTNSNNNRTNDKYILDLSLPTDTDETLWYVDAADVNKPENQDVSSVVSVLKNEAPKDQRILIAMIMGEVAAMLKNPDFALPRQDLDILSRAFEKFQTRLQTVLQVNRNGSDQNAESSRKVFFSRHEHWLRLYHVIVCDELRAIFLRRDDGLNAAELDASKFIDNLPPTFFQKGTELYNKEDLVFNTISIPGYREVLAGFSLKLACDSISEDYFQKKYVECRCMLNKFVSNFEYSGNGEGMITSGENGETRINSGLVTFCERGNLPLHIVYLFVLGHMNGILEELKSDISEIAIDSGVSAVKTSISQGNRSVSSNKSQRDELTQVLIEHLKPSRVTRDASDDDSFDELVKRRKLQNSLEIDSEKKMQLKLTTSEQASVTQLNMSQHIIKIMDNIAQLDRNDLNYEAKKNMYDNMLKDLNKRMSEIQERDT